MCFCFDSGLRLICKDFKRKYSELSFRRAQAAIFFELGGPHPSPLPPAGEGVKQHAARSSGLTQPRPSAAMARVDFPSPLAVPRSAGRGAGAAAQHAALRALTCCGCLSGVSAANKASSAAPPHARASQVARSEAEGHGQWGRLFLWLLSFWRDKKKVTAPPGAHPGQQRPQHPNKIKRQWPSQTPPPCATQTSESSPSTSSAAPRTRCSAAP